MHLVTSESIREWNYASIIFMLTISVLLLEVSPDAARWLQQVSAITSFSAFPVLLISYRHK